jgi:DNA-binding response OmpR family regulator
VRVAAGDRYIGQDTKDRRKTPRQLARGIPDTPVATHQVKRVAREQRSRATAVASVSEATRLLQTEVPDLLATDVVLTDGSSTSLVQQAEAAGAKTLMMTGNPDRIAEFDGAGQAYLSKPFLPDLFVQRVREMLSSD